MHWLFNDFLPDGGYLQHHQSQIKKLREQGHEYPFASPPHQVEEKESSSFDIAKILPIAILAFSATICFGIYFILCRTEETCEGKGLSIQSTPRQGFIPYSKLNTIADLTVSILACGNDA
jgi:hypothetical protein